MHHFHAEQRLERPVEEVCAFFSNANNVEYELPFGPLGRVVEALWARREIVRIFGYRTDVIARRFS